MDGAIATPSAHLSASDLETYEAAERAGRNIELARDCVSLAGALAHPDPNEAWEYVVMAKEMLALALDAVEVIKKLACDRAEIYPRHRRRSNV